MSSRSTPASMWPARTAKPVLSLLELGEARARRGQVAVLERDEAGVIGQGGAVDRVGALRSA